MSWPEPRPGLVIRYSYLWEREAIAGREEGAKDRPSAVVLAAVDQAGRTQVVVVPITHSEPQHQDTAIEPRAVKMHLGLDSDRSWIVISEANAFGWPGPDLRFLPGRGPETSADGFLPPRFFAQVRDAFLERRRQRRAAVVSRSE